MSKATHYYTEKLTECTTQLQQVSRKVKTFAWYRLIAFALIFVPVSVLGWKLPAATLTLVAVILFFVLIKKNGQLEKRKKRLSILKKLLEEELLALQHSFSHFPNGKEFLNTEHFFSYDLDLFGDGSLFQFLNRTKTFSGRQKLAKWLINPLNNKQEIDHRQEAISELSGIPAWRLNFLTEGGLFEETEELSTELYNWTEMDLELPHAKTVKWLIRVVPIITLLSIIPAALGITNFYLVVMVFVQFVLMYFFWGRINLYYSFFGRKSELLAKYMQLLATIENAEFKSQYLIQLQKGIRVPSASKVFSQLESLIKQFEFRQNILVGLALNGFLTWDIRCVYKLWQWHQKNHAHLADWLKIIAEMDAMVSLANYANNQEDFIFPEIHDGGFTYSAKELGHPLIEKKKRVANDFEINGWSKVVIVTGANMAGKSTFLRTVGVNLILARLGAPVCALKMRITPIDIYTNMRTTDSLLKDESYFFAELKRLKGVLERLESGERIFVILDEMLKGTNSTDKLNGSRELIKKLVQFKSVSLIATHDLKLSTMEDEFPQQVFNKCFEIRIENDELVFDYKLSDGATKTMNATFLMKKMGII